MKINYPFQRINRQEASKYSEDGVNRPADRRQLQNKNLVTRIALTAIGVKYRSRLCYTLYEVLHKWWVRLYPPPSDPF